MVAKKGQKSKKKGAPSQRTRSCETASPLDNAVETAKKQQEAIQAAVHAETAFPVVGIGASAGGLEALEELFDNLPSDTGMAFVVVTHQHPGHTSMLPELLRRKTEMNVVEATEGVQLQPNHVYVGPPGGQIAILDGRLHRLEAEKKEAPRLPIDYFFRSLATDQREKAICIVLSGTGTDGTLGMKAIKGESGMAMVQQPDSAKYGGMPSSAISTEAQITYCLLHQCRNNWLPT
jgi:two-component system CheB/CheR fusion protein